MTKRDDLLSWTQEELTNAVINLSTERDLLREDWKSHQDIIGDLKAQLRAAQADAGKLRAAAAEEQRDNTKMRAEIIRLVECVRDVLSSTK